MLLGLSIQVEVNIEDLRKSDQPRQEPKSGLTIKLPIFLLYLPLSDINTNRIVEVPN